MKFVLLLFYLIWLVPGNVFAGGKNISFNPDANKIINSINSQEKDQVYLPAAPVLVSPPAGDTIGVSDTAMVWRSVSGAGSYCVLIALDSANFTVIIEDTTVAGDTTLLLKPLIGTKLRVGAKYYWRVNASDSSGAGPYSTAWSFIPVPVGEFVPGAYWYDTDNHLIEAHGGGMLYDDSSQTYYWYGEYRTASDPYHAIGVSCYSSKDLYSWKFEGIVLSDTATNAGGNTPVLERPKVIYNDSTKKYVMWMHIDAANYSAARAGVAESDNPTGPFTYLGSERPNGQMSRDMTLFKDDDGKAYLIYSSENNATMDASLLTADYLHQSGKYARILINQSREAPAMFKYNNEYYLITSGTSGWAPNAAKLAYSHAPLGPWTLAGNPCAGKNSNITFGGQSTFVLPVQGKPGKFIFMADKWNPNDLPHSTYIWLPLKVDANQVSIPWYGSWDLSLFDQITAVINNKDIVPKEFSMAQNYPNPFNPVTKIRYSIPYVGTHGNASIMINVYDVLGREIAVLVNKRQAPGNYEATFDGNRFSSGVYIYVLRSGDNIIARKMILLK